MSPMVLCPVMTLLPFTMLSLTTRAYRCLPPNPLKCCLEVRGRRAGAVPEGIEWGALTVPGDGPGGLGAAKPFGQVEKCCLSLRQNLDFHLYHIADV